MTQSPTDRSSSLDGQEWSEAFAAKSNKAFQDALTEDVVLEASALRIPVGGREHVAMILTAGSNAYTKLLFTHQAVHENRTYMEWEVTIPSGREMAGVTVLTRDAEGTIQHIAIHHRPLDGLLEFAGIIADEVGDTVGPEHFIDRTEGVGARSAAGGPS